ncbi:hypothetical protein HHI36_017271 [Cryptolaemus montrouzieri]|uniref:TIR domain-containing protein n=1 Tax=Cryptolaemus montrouzieri TaxID=559131 RepID=A0ABD2NM17_9CUCU
MPGLSELLLPNNEIQLKNDIFSNLPNLYLLSLNGNKIDYIPRNIFQNLSNLEQLSLWNNELKNFEDGVFDHLTNLRLLELSLNKIETLSDYLFNNLRNLKNISLRRNNLKSISRKVFENCTLLMSLKLDQNPNLILVDDVFSNFTHLKSAYLSENKLKTLSATLFSGSLNLKTIHLDQNELEDLPQYIFKDLQKLQNLFLNYNELSYLHPEIFSNLRNLEELNLSYNNLSTLDQNILKPLKNLKSIDLSYNKITTLPEQILSRNKKLAKFCMTHNGFDFDESKFGSMMLFSSPSSMNLKKVDLSYNKIKKYPTILNTITTMEEINLEHNAIREIKVTDMKTSNPGLLKINLDFNNISRIDFSHSNLFRQKYADKFKTSVIMPNNPIFCDCQALDLAKYFTEDDHPVKMFLTLESGWLFKCSGPGKKDGSSLYEIPLENFTCSLDANCTNNGACSCSYRSLDTSILIDCSDRNLSVVPTLTLSAITNYDFVNYNQTEVHLEGNQLDASPNEYDGYSNITKLYLQKNKIKNITWLPESIQILDLRSNAIQKFDARSLRLLNNTKLRKLYLGNNSWTCNCEATNLSLYLREHIKKVDLEDIRCNRTGHQLMNLNEKDLCPLPLDIKLILAFIVVSCLLVVTSSIVFYYYYKKEIWIWLYSRGLLCCGGEDVLDRDKLYDAFVSFSHKDEDFVLEHLVPTLEGGDNPYKLCIHMRDFIPGELINTQIFNTVKNSRRTIVVLSSNFLESVWGKMEFRTAHTEAMREGRARVIILIYGDVDLNSLDDELKAYIKTNTYIKWGETWFWDKLKFALRIRNRKGKFSRRYLNMMQTIDSKFQLGKVKKQPKSDSVIETAPPVRLDAGNLEEKCLTCIA